MNTTIDVAKATRGELLNFLTLNYSKIKDDNKTLGDQIIYMSKQYKENPKKVMTMDLRAMSKETIETLENVTSSEETEKAPETTAEPNTSKKSPKKTGKSEPKSETKTADKANNGKKPSVSELPPTNSKSIPLAKMFAETITVEGNEFAVAHDIQSIQDLRDSNEKQEVIIFAFYWTKRHLKQYPYFENMLPVPESFKDDLDICQLMIVSDKLTVAYALSLDTDAFYTILPEDLEEFEGLRLCKGVEYQIYRQI